MGAGFWDATVIEIEESVIEVKASTGKEFGGNEFDWRLVWYCVGKVREKMGIELNGNWEVLENLKKVCEKAKIRLSVDIEVEIDIEISKGSVFKTTILRSKFEELINDYYEIFKDTLSQLLRDSKLSPCQISEVLISGGSSRILKFQTLIHDLFPASNFKSFNSHTSAIIGASCISSILSKSHPIQLQDLLYIDILTHSLGIDSGGGLITVLINRNWSIPCKKTQIFTTYSDSMTEILIQMFEGERALIKNCNHLGDFKIKGISLAPRGVPMIEVCFDIDANGILNVSACEKLSYHKITVECHTGRLNRTDIERFKEWTERSEREDEILIREFRMRRCVEFYVENVNKDMENRICDKRRDLVSDRFRKSFEVAGIDVEKYYEREEEI